jgi:hypothetical protein
LLQLLLHRRFYGGGNVHVVQGCVGEISDGNYGTPAGQYYPPHIDTNHARHFRITPVPDLNNGLSARITRSTNFALATPATWTPVLFDAAAFLMRSCGRIGPLRRPAGFASERPVSTK